MHNQSDRLSARIKRSGFWLLALPFVAWGACAPYTSFTPLNDPPVAMKARTAASIGVYAGSLQLPQGLDPQYFRAVVELTDGRTLGGQLSDKGLSLPLAPDQHLARLRILLPVFEIASDPVAVDPAKGLSFRFRFEPNDLGRVRFSGTPLTLEKDQLILARHGIELHFQHETRADR